MGFDKHSASPSPLATAYFISLGGGCQVSWYAVLNSLDFFNEKFPDNNPSFMFPIAVYLAQFIVTPIMAKISDRFTLSIRVIVPYLVVGAVLAYLPFHADKHQGSDAGFWQLMLFLFVMGFSSNISYSSIIGITSQMPSAYTTLFLIGSGVAGISMSVIKITMAKTFKQNKPLGVLVFFVFAAVFMVWCKILHMAFVKSQFYKTFKEEVEEQNAQSDSEMQYFGVNDSTTSTTYGRSSIKKPQRDFATMIKVLKEIKLYVFLLFLTFVQMNTVFPGIMLQKPISCMEGDTKVASMNMLFSIFFLVGKKLGQYRKYYNKYTITALVLFRFLLVLFFMLQAATSSIPILNTAWFAYFNILLFGLTNGFVTCALFILAPEAVEQSKKEISGFVSVFGLSTGVLLGTFTALPFRHLNANNPTLPCM